MSDSGEYIIRSYIDKRPLVGVAPQPPPSRLLGGGPLAVSRPIRIDGIGSWLLTRQADTNIYLLGASEQFPHSGIFGEQAPEGATVVATSFAEEGRVWYINEEWPGHYTIALADDKALGWTVGPDNNIVLGRLPEAGVNNATLPNPFYHLFSITPVLEE